MSCKNPDVAKIAQAVGREARFRYGWTDEVNGCFSDAFMVCVTPLYGESLKAGLISGTYIVGVDPPIAVWEHEHTECTRTFTQAMEHFGKNKHRWKRGYVTEGHLLNENLHP